MIIDNHKNITKKGLYSYFNESAIDVISKGNADSDEIFDTKPGKIKGYDKDAQHFNNASLKECEKFLKEAEKTTIEDFIEAAKSDDEKELMEAFYDLGRLTHSIQDFYSHTNWINLTGSEVNVWNENVTDPKIVNSDKDVESSGKLKTGKYWTWVQSLEKINLFNWTKDLKEGKKYEKTYLKSSDQSHFVLNKDEKGSIADKAFEAKHGVSGYEVAQNNAIEHTKQEWKEIDEILQKSLSAKEYKNLMGKIEAFDKADASIYDDMESKYRKNFNKKMVD